MKKFFSKEFLISLQVSKILILSYGFLKSVKFNLPVNNYTWFTSIYFNPTNNLKKLSNDLVSIKGIRQNLD